MSDKTYYDVALARNVTIVRTIDASLVEVAVVGTETPKYTRYVAALRPAKLELGEW